MRYISLNIGSYLVFHGYDADNQEMMDEVKVDRPVEKLIAVERILSATEKYLLVTGPFGRQMYWEYEGGLTALKARLAAAGLMID